MKKNFFKLLFTIILGLIICFGFNFIIDPYGVFGHFLDYQQLEPNQNYIKMDYLIKNKPEFDGYLFGSSRVGNIPTENIEKYKIYNMTYLEGMPGEWKNNIETLLKNGIKPKIIILGLDDFDFKISSDSHKNQQMRKSYEFLNDEGSLLKHYILVNPFTKYNINKLKSIVQKNKNVYLQKNLRENGRLFREGAFEKEKNILQNKQLHLINKVFERKGWYSSISFDIQCELNSIYQIQQIERLCNQNDIELIIFFNPVHVNSYSNAIDREYYSKIREKIKNEFKGIKIHDFSDIDILKDNQYWFETSHYTSEIGKKIIDNIFNNEI